MSLSDMKRSEAASATDHEAVWRRGRTTPRARAHTHTHTHTRRMQTTAYIGRGRVAKVTVCYFSTVATQQSLSTRGASTPLPHTHIHGKVLLLHVVHGLFPGFIIMSFKCNALRHTRLAVSDLFATETCKPQQPPRKKRKQES